VSSSTHPTISVVVVNWNRRELLKACLQSLASQTHPDFEVIVVDNGSADGSPALVQETATSYPVRLRLIANSDNRGFCAANNQGFGASRSELVALLNNDAEADPQWLAALEAAIRSGRDVGMAASKVLVWENPKRIDKAGHLIYPDGQNRGRGAGQLDHGQFDQVEETLWPDGCAAMYRRAMLDEVGGFDEDFFAYGDDAELGLRGRIAGWKCLYAPGAVARHHRGATLGLGSARRLTLIERNRLLLAVKLFPWNLLWVNGAYYLARIGAGLWAAVCNRGELRHYAGVGGKLTAALALARGTVSALPMIPSMLRKRRAFFSQPAGQNPRLTPPQIRALLMRHRIRLREITEQAV
jgi:GT2 family glycosyltransferase